MTAERIRVEWAPIYGRWFATLERKRFLVWSRVNNYTSSGSTPEDAASNLRRLLVPNPERILPR